MPYRRLLPSMLGANERAERASLAGRGGPLAYPPLPPYLPFLPTSPSSLPPYPLSPLRHLPPGLLCRVFYAARYHAGIAFCAAFYATCPPKQVGQKGMVCQLKRRGLTGVKRKNRWGGLEGQND